MTDAQEQPQFLTSADPSGPRWLLAPLSYVDQDLDIEITIPSDVALAPSAAPKESRNVASEWHTSPAAFLVHSCVVTVVPITTNTDRVYPFQVLLPASDTGLEIDSKAQAEQVRAVSVERVRDRIGSIPAPLMADVNDALRLHLAL